MQVSRWAACGWVLACVVWAPGAALAAQAASVDLVWPPPPEPARVRYVGAVRSEADVGRRGTFFGNLIRMLIGARVKVLGLETPHDVYVDGDGRIFVTDRAGGGRLVVFDPGQKRGRVIAPRGAGRLAKPMGLGGDGRGRVFVADPAQRRVVALTAEGEFVRAYGGRELLLNPVDVAVAPGGDRIYVVDSYLHQVVIFDAEGRLLRRVGRDLGDLSAKQARVRHRSPSGEADSHADEPSDLVENRGSGPSEFRYPAFLAVAPDGRVYVSDQMNFRIQILDPDGNCVGEFGFAGDVPGSFARPKGVGVDRFGHVYVADAAFNNVQVFDPDGRLLLSVGAMGRGPGEFWQPLGLAADARDRIFVADRFNDRVQIFQYLPREKESPGTAATEGAKGG